MTTNRTNPDMVLVMAVYTFLLVLLSSFLSMEAPSKLNAGTLFNKANANENVAI